MATAANDTYSVGAGQNLFAGDSKPLVGVTFGPPYKYNNGYPAKYASGDTFHNTWADDDEIYSTVGDFFTGFSSDGPYSLTAFVKLDGFTNDLTGSTINNMRKLGYHGVDGFGSEGDGNYTWKASGLISIAGTLYMMISRHRYGDSGSGWVQTAVNAQIIKSSDHGETWTPEPPEYNLPFASPMFPGGDFGAACFVLYDKDYAGPKPHGADSYVYAVSPDGVWNNGNRLILGRCLLSSLADLDGTDWQFYTGGDGQLSENWSSSTAAAASIVSSANKTSMTSVQFLPFCNRYVMFEWYYPSLVGAVTPVGTNDTWWDIYESPTPWGTWTKIQSTRYQGKGLYNPTIIQKSISIDRGRNVQLITCGDYQSQAIPDGDYQLTLVSATFRT